VVDGRAEVDGQESNLDGEENPDDDQWGIFETVG
jgi:hypothetical protein